MSKTSRTIVYLKQNEAAIVLDSEGSGFLKLPDKKQSEYLEHEQILEIVFQKMGDPAWRKKFLTEELKVIY